MVEMTADELPLDPNNRRERLPGCEPWNEDKVSRRMIAVLRHARVQLYYDVQGLVSMHDFRVECTKKGRACFIWAAVFHMLQCHGKESDQSRWTLLRMSNEDMQFAIRATQGHSEDMSVALGNLHTQLSVADVKALGQLWRWQLVTRYLG